MSRIFALLILGVWPVLAEAQVADTMNYFARRDTAIQLIEDLKSGTVVVRLNTGHAKISALERSLANPRLSKRRRARIESLIATEKADRELRNRALAASFATHFKFTDYRLLPDTALTLLQDGVREGIFLNQDLEPDSTLALPPGRIVVAAIGYTRSQDGSSVADALVLHDLEYNQLESPFPYYSDLPTVGVVGLKVIKKEENAIQTHMDHLVQRIHVKLSKFYERKVE